MASDHTPNYGLNQWELTDKVVMKDFNADNAAIDAAIKAEADARAAADGAINTALGKKADKTALTAVQNSLNSEISNRKSAVESLTEQSKLHTILSLGAGGSTKMVDPEKDHIERVFNLKFPQEYIQRPEKIAANQAAFRAFYANM